MTDSELLEIERKLNDPDSNPEEYFLLDNPSYLFDEYEYQKELLKQLVAELKSVRNLP